MKKRVVRLSVLQTGKMLAVLYAFISLIALPFMLIGMIVNFEEVFPMFFMLLLYPVMAFIMGVLMAIFYNIAAKWVGGIEVTVVSSEGDFKSGGEQEQVSEQIES